MTIVPDISAVSQVIGGLASIAASNAVSFRRNSLGTPEVIAALQEFMECVRYLNTRRSTGAALTLESEAAVQDALYLILRPWVRDLVPETPTDKTGNRYSIRDFVSKSLRFVLEAKFVRDAAHGKAISKEIHDDIEVYRHNATCDTIIFFVFDPESLAPDERELRRVVEQSRVYDGRALSCKLIVKP